MEEKVTKKYGVFTNSLFMLREAKDGAPSVIVFTVLQAALAVAVSVLELYVSPVILKRLETHSAMAELLLTILLFTLGIITARASAAYVDENLRFGRIEVRERLMQKVRAKTGACSYPLRERQEFMDLLAKACDTLNDNVKASEAIWDTFAGLLQNMAGFLIYLYLLKNVDALMVVVTIVTAAIGWLVSHYVNEWNYRHREEEMELVRKIRYIQERAQDRFLAKDIRIFGMQEWLRELHDKYFRMHRSFCGRRELRYFCADAADAVLATLRNGIAYTWLLYSALEGKVSAAEFLLYFTAVSGFTAWVGGIMENVSLLHRQGLELSAVREYLSFPELFQMEGGQPLTVDGAAGCTVTLRDVTFRYPKSEKAIFSHLNLTLHAGEKLAVVGLNGAGKTTLVKLICGFYDPDEGEVLLNGVNIKAYNRRDYYALISGVFQDFSLLPATVAENVAQSVDAPDMERVRDCVEKAGLKSKIEALEQGYETLLEKTVYEDAAELSGGELQRLMLARLLYKDSPIMVLDEPTAALDPIAESDIYRRYNELTAGKSAVFISHRLASTRFCDRILLIEEGQVAEEGTHEELLRNGKRYAELFALQSRYYQEETL
ncbi:MAG: ABC transporter ATP-binding protein/permease [Roseburia sp.]|nr:ABC transporter ATP-binding protein/permease [Roseburia sp.]